MDYLTTTEVAKRYGVHPKTVTAWCSRSLFPNMITGAKTGGGASYLIPASDLEGFTPPTAGRPPVGNPSAQTEAKRRSRGRA